MKFIGILSAFFAVFYALLALHYVNFDKAQKQKELNLIASRIKDVQISTAFISKEYGKFVYDK